MPEPVTLSAEDRVRALRLCDHCPGAKGCLPYEEASDCEPKDVAMELMTEVRAAEQARAVEAVREIKRLHLAVGVHAAALTVLEQVRRLIDKPLPPEGKEGT